MNALTVDVVSLIATRDFHIIKHDYSHGIVYTDNKGNYHRINGPSWILYGDIWYWYFNGERHRYDQTKPAIKIGNYYYWYNMGKLVESSRK